MKKRSSYIILLLALLISGGAKAEVRHYVGAQAGVGEWSLWTFEATHNDRSFGAAGSVGFVYELQAGPKYGQTYFLLHTGLEAHAGITQFSTSSLYQYEITESNTVERGKDIDNNRNFTYVIPDVIDSDGDPFTYTYVLSGRTDRYNKLVARIPVMIGVQHKRFYMLAGAKIGYNLLTTYKAACTLTTYGQYSDIHDITNRPDRQFFDAAHAKTEKDFKNSDGRVKTVNPLSVDVCLEIGGRLGEIYTGTGYDVPKRTMELRLAGFVEYGLFGFNKWSNQSAVSGWPTAYNASDMTGTLVLKDIMSSTEYIPSPYKYGITADKSYIGHNFMIGLKFTVLFQMPEKGKCVLCRDNYNGG